VGVDEDKPPQEPDGRRPWGDRPEDYLGVGSRTIMGIVFAVLYIATFGPRTGWLPGVVSGILGGVVVWLLLKEVDARVKRRRARDPHHRR
jgi:hypothetical protein